MYNSPSVWTEQYFTKTLSYYNVAHKTTYGTKLK